MRNFQYVLLPCSGLEIEVGVMLSWQRTRLGAQAVQFESDAAGIVYGEISCLMIDVQHGFTRVLSHTRRRTEQISVYAAYTLHRAGQLPANKFDRCLIITSYASLNMQWKRRLHRHLCYSTRNLV